MVYLADVEGRGYRQIAEMTGVSIGTVKSSLHRGRVQLRAILGDQYRPGARGGLAGTAGDFRPYTGDAI